MKPYIEFNTRKRQQAKTVFEHSLCKMSNNSTFGKTMKNVTLRKISGLVSVKLKCKKLVAKPQLKQFRIINENKILIDRIKEKVTFGKPIFAGFAILKQSKVLMYDFHNTVIVKNVAKMPACCLQIRILQFILFILMTFTQTCYLLKISILIPATILKITFFIRR
jgi:hypothetical protein